MNRNLLSASFLIAMAALGCSQPQFTYYVPPGVSVQKFETIAVDPRSDYAFIVEGMRQIKDPEVQNLVLAELQAKGYHLAPPDQADLWVNAVLLVKSFRLNAGSYGGHGSHGGATGGHGGMGHGGHSSGPDVGSHGGGSSHSGGNDTTVLVQLVTRSSLERIWFGTGVIKPTKDASGHHGDQPLFGTVKCLLEPLQARPAPTQKVAMD